MHQCCDDSLSHVGIQLEVAPAFSSWLPQCQSHKAPYHCLHVPWSHSHCYPLVQALLTSLLVSHQLLFFSTVYSAAEFPDFSNADLTRLHLKILGLLFSSHYTHLCISCTPCTLYLLACLCFKSIQFPLIRMLPHHKRKEEGKKENSKKRQLKKSL